MTYNQKDYIEQCINSILDQQIDIDFDILIHDDCSDDGTYEILINYQRQYPEKISIIHQESRKFLIDGFNMMIFKYVVPHINSKYVAYCDGDDYWCDEYKLEKQYEFMELHPEYAMCFHNSYQLKHNNDMSSLWYIKDEDDIGLQDLISEKPGVPIATSSFLVKSSVFKDFSDWRKEYSVEDLPLYITAALTGKIHRLKDIMCVYRQFSQGSWSSQNQGNVERLISHQENLIKAINTFNAQTECKYDYLVKNHIAACEFRIAMLKRDYKSILSKKNKRFINQLSKKTRLSLKLQYMFPHLYNIFQRKKNNQL